MNIILWAPFGAGTHYWGPGTSAYRLYKNINNKNIKLTLVHGSDEQDSFPEVFDEQIKISSLKGNNKFKALIFLIKSYLWLRKNHHKYDAFHGITAFYFTFFPAWYFNKNRGNTFIKITGGNGGFGHNNKLSKILGISRIRKNLANDITGYIAISSFIENNLKEYGIHKDKIIRIPNGVDINKFIPLTSFEKNNKRNSLNITNKLTFIYVGGLTHNKRIINMVHAVSYLKKQGYTDFQLLIVGPDRSNNIIEHTLTKTINELNLQNSVKRISFNKKPESYLQVADVFLLISEMEGLSNSLLEAMSCGLPAIVTKISGSEDLVEQGINGFFSNGTPEDVANCMSYFLDKKIDIKTMSIKSRNKIIESYSNSIVLEKHLEIFKYAKNKIN